ncbi:MAG: PTS sugar transporter subunit IIA [Bacillota bacterium]
MKYEKIYAPVKGFTKDITTCKDQVFAEKIVGDGIVINPANKIIKSPCKGKINQIFKTNHAFTIIDEYGTEILIHLGIDTVELNGSGFKRLISNINQTIDIGEPIIEMDLDYISSKNKSTDIIIIISDSNQNYKIKKVLNKEVDYQDYIFKYKKK